MFQTLPKNSWLLLQNLIGSHDTARILTIIRNRNILKNSAFEFNLFFTETQASINKSLIVTKPNNDDIRIFKNMVIFQMTFPGSPLIMYGDEAGMWGGNDPDCRKPMLWEDLQYDDEVYFIGGKKEENKVEVNKEIFDFYSQILNLRNSENVLTEGNFLDWIVDDNKELYGFWREKNYIKIGVVFNNSWKDQEIELTGIKNYIVLLEEGNFKKIAQEEKIIKKISSKSALIIKIISSTKEYQKN